MLTVNEIYGIYYATPKEIIDTSISEGNFPILDWPVAKMEVMINAYKDQLFVVYIEPENLDIQEKRLLSDGRDKDGRRFAEGCAELEDYYLGKFDAMIDKKFVNKDGKDKEIAAEIYELLSY